VALLLHPASLTRTTSPSRPTRNEQKPDQSMDVTFFPIYWAECHIHAQ
jgi:hypothetical protein